MAPDPTPTGTETGAEKPAVSEAERLALEYAERMIDVKGAPPTKAKSMIEVAAFEDLARLAEKNGRMILHASDGGEHHFYVDDAGTTYHLAAGERTDRKPRTRRA